MPERVIDGGLPLAVLPVVGRLDQEGVSCQGDLDDLPRRRRPSASLGGVSPLGRSPSRPNLRHHQFGWRSVRQAELRAMRVADPDMFDEAKDLGVPRHGQARTSATVRTGVTLACGADRFVSIGSD